MLFLDRINSVIPFLDRINSIIEAIISEALRAPGNSGTTTYPVATPLRLESLLQLPMDALYFRPIV
jgi:hypothetical protein